MTPLLTECVGVPVLLTLPSIVAPDWKPPSPLVSGSIFCSVFSEGSEMCGTELLEQGSKNSLFQLSVVISNCFCFTNSPIFCPKHVSPPSQRWSGLQNALTKVLYFCMAAELNQKGFSKLPTTYIAGLNCFLIEILQSNDPVLISNIQYCLLLLRRLSNGK